MALIKSMATRFASFARLTRASAMVALTAFGLTFAAATAQAETLLMPQRPFLASTSEVVWGITTQANGTAYTIDFGDGVTSNGTVADRSYIAFNHIYGSANTYTVTLTVGAEVATVSVNVYNAGSLTADALRNLNVDRAIQDGLRYLWTSQSNRTTFNTTVETAWGAYQLPFTALVVLAFENQGYQMSNDNNTPVGIFPKYVVRRGFNFILARLSPIAIGTTPAGNNPCVAVPADTHVCDALYANTTSYQGYENALAILPFAGSGALNRTVPAEVVSQTGASVTGKSFGEVLQRMVNATTWGQNDSGVGRGGWYYYFNQTSSDGSTVGWNMLALLDASAAGATVPAWVKTEWSAPGQALVNGINTDGSFDYQADGVPSSDYFVNVAKSGVGVQGTFFAGRPVTDTDVQHALTYISDRWSNQGLGQQFVCGNGTYNKGCAYGMFNVFKGFKLYGVQTLAGVGRAAGPGAIPANDWYADYVDYLISTQTSQTSPGGGNWGSLPFSSQLGVDDSSTALAELILSPVALVLPDPVQFSSLGLQQGNPLSINPSTNPVDTQHTVVAIAKSTGGTPIAGVTISFLVSGRNNGKTGSGTTDATGQVSFTYTDLGPASPGGVDTIQAFIGQVGSNTASNVLQKTWVAASTKCDVDNNGVINTADLLLIKAGFGQVPTANDPRDANSDGAINIADQRYCQLRLTPTPPPTN